MLVYCNTTQLVQLYARRYVELYAPDAGRSVQLYYLRPLKHCQSRATARVRSHATARGVVVEYMDRAQGHTVDFFAQTLPVTLSTTAKLTSLKHLTVRDEHTLDTKRTSHTSTYGNSWL